MTTAFAVPASLEEIIQRFDAREEPFNEFSVSGELNAARGALVEPADAESLGAWAEVLAFALATDRHENPWNSYFGPMGSGVKADGTKVYFPDISDTPPEGRGTLVHTRESAETSLSQGALRRPYVGNEWAYRATQARSGGCAHRNRFLP
jgi:hypothetical protein